MKPRDWLFMAACIGAAALTAARAQEPAPPAVETAATAKQETPFRLELGGYGSRVDHGFGYWKGLEGQLWVRASRRFIPVLFVTTETRPAGTQQNYGFFSYLNWNRWFYTVQGFTGAPQRSDTVVYFPKKRYDVKGFWKLPPSRNFVLGAGFTRFDFGAAGHGQIFNPGFLYYRGKAVIEGNGFINRQRDIYTGAASISVQYGAEGRYWLGATVGGGRELYRYVGIAPVDVFFSGYSGTVFLRKWLTRHMGIVTTFEYQQKLDLYRRLGLGLRLFFEF